MHKLLAISFVAVALAACSNMTTNRMGSTSNPQETKNSTDANKSANPAAVSPAPGGSSSGGGGNR